MEFLLTVRNGNRATHQKKRRDRTPQMFGHAGLLTNGPPATIGLPFI
jgi:hypothetical protein